MFDKQAARSLRACRFLILTMTAAALLANAGCGYHREGRGVSLPPDVRRVAIPVFRNDTFESGLKRW
ncbi:MAG: hypothetical protein M5R36_21770 [Deltaproteobacteria bacterium]|nr:hypothetical protein [Deltaproteobacteria bacterium]